jgi:predicted O-methyltransferase YrrM
MNTGLIFYRIAKYLEYIFVSENRNGHGIHSPFVYYIVTSVFRNKTDHSFVSSIEKIRKRLMSDNTIIELQDHGAGSCSLRNNLRKVSDIARHSPVTEKYGRLLAGMAAEFGRPLIVEFGTSFGISTMYMASMCGEAEVITVEGSRAASEIAVKNFKEAGLKNIRLIKGTFEESIPDIIYQGIIPGLIFIDGDHRKKPLLENFEKMAGISDSNTVIIIDDINYSREMEEAWNEIKRYRKVTLTIDILRMGIVFFRKGIVRNNYIIRY